MNFDISTFNVALYDEILGRGLSHGVGKQDGQMCIEAAICATLGLPHGDDPGCVAASVRAFKISLNDKKWVSVVSRATGLRNLGLAQLGSKDVVADADFVSRLTQQIIKVLIPKLFRQLFPTNSACLIAADNCEKQGTHQAANAAANAAYAADAADAAAYAAAYAADAANAADAAAAAAANAATAATNAANAAAYAAAAAAYAAANAAYAANAAAYAADEFLILGAEIALQALIDLKSPGVALLSEEHSR